MDGVLQDIRYALRSYRRRPMVVAGVLASLAIGIAANTAVFSIVNGVLLREVPGVTRPERLAEIARAVAGTTADVSVPMYRHLHAQTGVLEDLAALALTGVSISSGDGAAAVRGALVVTGNYFSLLGVRAASGRVFAPGETLLPAVAPAVVITHELWQHAFGGADDAVGREARVNGTAVRVIGVLPRGFTGHHTGLLIDVFLPLGVPIPGLPDPATLTGPGSSVELLGRLREGVSLEQATRTLSAAADGFGRQTGESNARAPYAVSVASWGPLPSTIRSGVAAFLSVLFLLVGLALTMACINVSTLLLARASERQRELAVRRALGASEGRLARQILTEVGVLFIGAGVLGAGAAAWLTGRISGAELPIPIPGRLGADLSADGRVVLFALVLTLAAALAFSLLPAFRASRFNLVPALREAGASGSRGRSRMRAALIGVQVAVTSAMLAATLTFGRALASMRGLDPGWNGNGVVVAPIDLEQNGTTRDAGPARQREILDRLGASPGVEVAALATKLPGGGRSSFGLVSVPGVEPPSGLPGFPAALNRVSPNYFRTMRIPLLRGRDIDRTDEADADRVAVVNATMAQRLWPESEPLGRSFFIDQGDRRLAFRVIGVARDAEQRAPGQAPENFYYVPAAQWYNPAVVLHVRGAPGQEADLAATVVRVVREVDRSIPISTARPLREALGIYLLPQRLAAWVSGAMGLFGLLLAIVGVYGLMVFQVTRRARELAVRMALGATHGDVTRLLLLREGRVPLIGMGVGVLFAAALSFGASRVVVGARAFDPVVLVAVPLLLLATSLVAMLAPVVPLLRRPPMERLRED